MPVFIWEEPGLRKDREKNWKKLFRIMNPTENKSDVDNRKIVIIGAGKIGRSFIGQLFPMPSVSYTHLDVYKRQC